MAFLIPRLCGIRSRYWAFFIAFLELALHIYLFTVCITFILETSDQIEKEKSAEEHGDGYDSDEKVNGTIEGGSFRNTTALDGENLEEAVVEMIEMLGTIFELGKMLFFYVAIFGAAYELVCVPAILILICGLYCRVKWLSVPWLVKTIAEIALVLFLIATFRAEVVLILLILLLLLGYELLASYLIVSGVTTMNGSMDMNGQLNGGPTETEMSLMGTHHEQQV